MQLADIHEERPEFFKLDKIDRKVLFWLIDNSPRSVGRWVDHIAGTYQKSMLVKIDSQRLRAEIAVAVKDMTKLGQPKA
jgi:hypothetical protein